MSMTITQYPEEVCCSGNTTELVVSGCTGETLFILSPDHGESMLLNESYFPNIFGEVHVDIRKIVEQYRYLVIPTSDEFNQQHAFEDDYGFRCGFQSVADPTDTVVYDFYPFKAKANLADEQTSVQWAKANWITNQPQVKRVDKDAPEYLHYYFAADNLAVYFKVWKADGSSAEFALSDITVTATEDMYHTFNVSWNRLVTLSQVTDPILFIDVYVKDTNKNTVESYVQRYIGVEAADNSKHILFEDAAGGLDVITFRSPMKHSVSASRINSIIQSQRSMLLDDDDDLFEITDDFPNTYSSWLAELSKTQRAWIMEDEWKPIVITKSDMVDADDNMLKFGLEFRPADAERYVAPTRSSLTTPMKYQFKTK